MNGSPWRSMRSMRGGSALVIGGIGIALLVVLLAPLASNDPDGLERVAIDQGFADRAEDAPFTVAPGYTAHGVDDDRLATVLAGAAGVLLTAALVIGGGSLLRRRATRRHAPPQAAPDR